MDDPILVLGLILCFGMGLVVSLIADGRKLPGPFAWFLYGLFLWPVALIHVLLTQPPAPAPDMSEMRKCPECAEMIRAEARKCRYCQSAVAPVVKRGPSNLQEQLRKMGR